jgi:site-specific DNA recombinase
MSRVANGPGERQIVRCAIYCRKSTEEGLEQEFNSIHAQRESAEAYIASQQGEGWVCLPDDYSDGGFTGATMDRPALKQVLADIEAGKIDAVVVYKIDRLSRSLIDFTRILEVFEKHQVAFIAVTQAISTATSAGRLMLNILFSFAQFERELISERTRDKISASRRKGKWSGGMPLLGYDLDEKESRLHVNDDEAERVGAIYKLYLELGSMLPVVEELDRRGWRNKRWKTRKGRESGGKPFDRTSLHRLLSNPAYIGRVRHKAETYPGEHAAIIDADLWRKVQSQLQANSSSGGATGRNRFGALLKGLIRCIPCDCAMSPSHSKSKGKKRYRYYVCSKASKIGWKTCPSKALLAQAIEQFVVDHIRCVSKDAALIRATLAAAQEKNAAQVAEFERERRGLEREMTHADAKARELTARIDMNDSNAPGLERLATLQERIRVNERRRREIAAPPTVATSHATSNRPF